MNENYECDNQINIYEYLNEKEEQVEYDNFSRYMEKPVESGDDGSKG